MTRKELWESLPEALRVNEVKFKEMLEEGVGTEWEKKGNGGRDGFRFQSAEMK